MVNKSINNNFTKSNIIDFNSYISKYNKVNDFVDKCNPDIPVYCFRPELVKNSVSFFKDNFNFSNHKSRILYSVKSNPDDNLLKLINSLGVNDFDVASINEIKLINKILGKGVNLYFMHPVKSYESISLSYHNYNIRDFSLDTHDELYKILQATNYAKDLNLHVRLAIPCSNSAIELSTKFGILPSQAIDLIKDVAKYSSKTGICFHVGSQCMDPIEYRKAIMIAGDLIEKNKLKIDIFDIGGGFPAKYTSMNPPSIKNYFNEIKDSLKYVNINNECEIWCEPGRSLVAESSSLLVRVEARKDNILYINDGTYGGLFDAGSLEFSFPVRGLRSKNLQEKLDDNMQDFSFYGPTCDSIDFMKGPFYLPKNIKTGDYIEIFQLGSYSKSMRSNFNGFNDFKEIIVEDRPFLSIFEHNQNKLDNEKERSS